MASIPAKMTCCGWSFPQGTASFRGGIVALVSRPGIAAWAPVVSQAPIGRDLGDLAVAAIRLSFPIQNRAHWQGIKSYCVNVAQEGGKMERGIGYIK